MIRISSRLALMATSTFALLILLSGCGKQKYRSLEQLPKTNTFTSKDASIQGSYTVLNGTTCRKYIGCNLLNKGYQPIHITLTNNSNLEWYFDLDDISLPTVSAYTVSNAAQKNLRNYKIGTAVAITSGGIAYTAAVTASSGPTFWLVGPLVVLFGLFHTALANLIGVSISSSLVRRSNDTIDASITTRSLNSQLLPPHTTISGLIFVRNEDFRPMFEIALTNSGTKPVILASNPDLRPAMA